MKTPFIRLFYYQKNQKDIDSKNDEHAGVRLFYYEKNPEDLEAKFDSHFAIRIFYYKNNNQDVDFKADTDWIVRRMYYQINTHDLDRLNEENGKIIMICSENLLMIEEVLNRKFKIGEKLTNSEIHLIQINTVN
jgi:hypothetical protein